MAALSKAEVRHKIHFLSLDQVSELRVMGPPETEIPVSMSKSVS